MTKKFQCYVCLFHFGLLLTSLSYFYPPPLQSKSHHITIVLQKNVSFFFCNDPEIEVIKTCEKRCSVMLSTVSCVGKKRSNEEERKNSEIFHLAFRLV